MSKIQYRALCLVSGIAGVTVYHLTCLYLREKFPQVPSTFAPITINANK